ncbi:MAG: class I SAM-dependent methyltransferase [bacterium]
MAIPHSRFFKVIGSMLAVCLCAAPVLGAQPEKTCEYVDDILSVSLPGQEGQPAAIDFTSNDFATYKRNLGFQGSFGWAYTGKRVLDVGAGLSEFVDIMSDRYDVDALAIDVAYAELDLTGLSAECVDVFHRRRISMDAQRILFPSNYFDLVVSHSLLSWFFIFDPKPGEDPRLRIRRGMEILGQMTRVTNQGGEVRTTDFPDPYGEWYAEHCPTLVNDYRAAFKEFMRPYSVGEQSALEISFHYAGDEGYTVIRKLERIPRVDARSSVSVIRNPRRHQPRNPDR